MARSRIWCCLSLSLVVTVIGCGPVNDGEHPGVGEGEVQAEGVFSQAAIVQDGSQAAKATGALEIPLRDASGQPAFVIANQLPIFGSIGGLPVFLPVRGTCGVTFISPHFAVTAAHCVVQTNVPDPPNNPLIVRQYDVTNASLLGLNAAALIKGTFPNYQPLSTPMQNVPGYQSTAYTCHVVSRCTTPIVSNSAAFNCDFTGDVAMLHCDDRPSNAPWLPVASSDPGTGPVEMYWFHELLSPIPLTQPAPGSSAAAFDRFAHYSVLNGDTLAAQEANWHYLGGTTNALLPFKSIPFPNGAAHKRISAFGATDLFGCHGTSGSGVLQRNTAGNLELLGPVHTGGSWANTHLCDNPETLQPGQLGLTYEMNAVTQKLQAKFSTALRFDRMRIIVEQPPLGGVSQ